MSTTHIIPTTGRIVLYRGEDGATRPAIVVTGNGPFNADLYIFPLNATDRDAGFRSTVTHADPEQEPGCRMSWHWMPYQKQQAEKHATEATMKPAPGAAHAGYSTMQPHQQRVVDEKAELDERITKLAAFFDTPIFAGLPKDEQTRLDAQGAAMTAYSVILGERIDAFAPASDELRMLKHADIVRESGWKANYGDGQQNTAWAPNLKPGDGTPV